MCKPTVEMALAAGIRDVSYPTVRYGRVPAYEGEALIRMPDGKLWLAKGHGPSGSAEHIAREGRVEFHLVTEVVRTATVSVRPRGCSLSTPITFAANHQSLRCLAALEAAGASVREHSVLLSPGRDGERYESISFEELQRWVSGDEYVVEGPVCGHAGRIEG